MNDWSWLSYLAGIVTCALPQIVLVMVLIWMVSVDVLKERRAKKEEEAELGIIPAEMIERLIKKPKSWEEKPETPEEMVIYDVEETDDPL